MRILPFRPLSSMNSFYVMFIATVALLRGSFRYLPASDRSGLYIREVKIQGRDECLPNTHPALTFQFSTPKRRATPKIHNASRSVEIGRGLAGCRCARRGVPGWLLRSCRRRRRKRLHLPRRRPVLWRQRLVRDLGGALPDDRRVPGGLLQLHRGVHGAGPRDDDFPRRHVRYRGSRRVRLRLP